MIADMRVRVLLISLLVFFCHGLPAQDFSALDKMNHSFSAHCISMDFTSSIRKSAEIRIAGSVQVQGNAYHLDLTDLQIFCDGEDIWMVDGSSKEVYIEKIVSGPDAYMQNPVLLFADLDSLFSVVSVHKTATEGGKEQIRYMMAPKRDCGVKECCVAVSPDGNVSSGSFKLSDDTVVDVMVSSVRKMGRKDIASFRPDNSFDGSWTVTDLR